ncbi:MAG: hypothetical protein ACFFG0_42650, partial [Candidatus Thorarchaeota archaeon]
MIQYLFAYNFETGHKCLNLKDINSEHCHMIGHIFSAINSFANKLFDKNNERIKSIFFNKYIIKDFILFEDLNIDLLFIYELDDDPFIEELYFLIKGFLNQYKPLFNGNLINIGRFEHIEYEMKLI